MTSEKIISVIEIYGNLLLRNEMNFYYEKALFFKNFNNEHTSFKICDCKENNLKDKIEEFLSTERAYQIYSRCMDDYFINLSTCLLKNNKPQFFNKYRIEISKKISEEQEFPDFKSYEKNGDWNCLVFTSNSKAFVRYDNHNRTIEQIILEFYKENEQNQSERELIRVYKGCDIIFCNKLHEEIGKCTPELIMKFDRLFEKQ